MRRNIAFLYLVALLILVGILSGWGYEAHRGINQLAAGLIPGQFGEFLYAYRDTLAHHAPDPDYWKNDNPDEGYRHYIDADYYGRYPFDDIPRNRDSLIARYGESNVKQWGIGPWAIEEYCQLVTRLLKSEQWHSALLSMAALGHYVADLHMPLHVVSNYNGQFSGNEGIHFRWETQMVNKLVQSYEPVGEVIMVSNPLKQAFDIVKESFSVHARLLRADSLARSPLTPEQAVLLKSYKELPFEAEYLTVLYNETEDVIHDRLGRAAARVASYWYTCWINAGSPECPLP